MPGNFHVVPESVVESWPEPNYVDPVRRQWLPALSCSLLGISTILVAGRFYLRARKQAGGLGLDDLFVFIGWIISIGLSTVAVIDPLRYGLDVHTWDVRLHQYEGAAFMGFIAQILFLASTCATKISVLLFYRRMVKDAYSRRWLYAIWAALGCTAAYFVAVLIAYCLICQPLNAYWKSYNFNYDKPFTCLNGDILSPFVGVMSVVSDIYAVLLPCLMLRHYDLDVPRRQKIGLNIIFSLGAVVAGCGIARTYYLWKINHTYDTSWAGFDLFVWSLLECHLAIVFACAPSLRAFVRRYLGDTMRRDLSSSPSFSGDGRQEMTPIISRSQSIGRSASELEMGKMFNACDQRNFLTQAPVAQVREKESWTKSSTLSGETVHPGHPVHQIDTRDGNESYNMEQLHRYGPEAKHAKPRPFSDMNQHSWLSDVSSEDTQTPRDRRRFPHPLNEIGGRQWHKMVAPPPI